MDIKRKLVSGLAVGSFCSLAVLNSYADIIGDDAFLIADNVIAGIGKDGAFGSVAPIPVSEFGVAGIGGNRIGYLSDPSKQNFGADFDGDFFFPGFPEEGWGVTVKGINYNNNRNEQTVDIPGSLSNFQNKLRFSSVDWTGIADNLEIKQTYRTYNQGLSIIIDVEMKNASSVDMDNVYFMRTVDPDNNQANINNPTGTFETTNTIVKQGDIDSLSAVSASQARAASAGNSVVTLSAYSANSRAAYGAQRIRNPQAVYNGTSGLQQTGSNTEDKAIAVAFKFDKILPGETVSFTHAYGLADLPIPDVELDPDNSSGLTGGAFKQLYMLGTTGVPIVDDDVAVTGSASQLLQGLKVKITNPITDDLLTITQALPAGTILDSEEANTDTEISITGPATINEYMDLLKSIRFENQDLQADLSTRELVVQVLDETFLLSNSNISQIFITVPLVIDPNISGDDILSQSELPSDLTISGTAAPNSNLTLELTDSDNNTLTKNFVVGPDGKWSTDIPSSELPAIAEGPVQVAAKSTDQFSNETTDDAEFLKDTEVTLSVTRPTDGTVVTSSDVVVAGDSEPEAEITVTTIDGKQCATVADAAGKWECTLTGLEKGKMYPLNVLAKDKIGNENTETLDIEVNRVDLIVESPAYEAVTDDNTPLIEGKTEPNFDVTVTDEFGKVCSTTANSNGDWTCELAAMPADGPYDVTVVAKDPNSTDEATLPWRVAIPKVSLDVTEPLLNAEADDNTPLIKGTTDPNAEVKVTTPFATECTTTADALGNWSCELPAMPAEGPHALEVVAKDPVTNSETTLPWGVRIPEVSLGVSEPANNAIVDDPTPLLKGQSDPGTEIVIAYAPNKECKTVTDASGNWSCELDEMPSGGPYDLDVTATDPQTNSETKLPWRVGVAENPLDVDEPVENSTVTDSPVTVKGSTNPGSEVKVVGPQGQECTTLADATGAWECELENMLSGEDQDLTVTSTSPGGIQKVVTRRIDIAIEDGTVTTALKGGTGSLSPSWLLLVFSLLFTRKRINKNKFFSKH